MSVASMKILMGSSYFSSHLGGVELVAGMLFKEFSVLGHEIVWMAGDITPPPEAAGKSRTASLRIFNFVEDKTGIPFPVPSLKALKMIVREVRNADVLVLHDCLYLGNIFAFLAAKWTRIPTVIIQHVGFIPYRSVIPNLILRLGNAVVTRPMLSRASQVVFVGEVTRKYFDDVGFTSPPRVIFNGVDAETFCPLTQSETIQQLRREFGLPEDGVVILFVGRFVERKGITALMRMAEERPDWTWAFAGWGTFDPNQRNLSNIRVFSSLPTPSLARLYRCCSLFVLPSSGEGGFPLVAREALASGLPVVCGRESLDADPSMENFAAAAPVYPDDDERTAREFLSEIDRVLTSEAESGSKAEARRRFVVSRSSWRSVAEQHLELISHVVTGEKLSPPRSEQSSQGVQG